MSDDGVSPITYETAIMLTNADVFHGSEKLLDSSVVTFQWKNQNVECEPGCLQRDCVRSSVVDMTFHHWQSSSNTRDVCLDLGTEK